MKDTARPMGSGMDSPVHGHLLCFDLVHYYWDRSLRAAHEKVEDVERGVEGEQKKI